MQLGVGLLTRAGEPRQLPLQVGGLPLEGAYAGDVGEETGGGPPELGDLLLVEGGDPEELDERRADAASLLLELAHLRAGAERELVERSYGDGPLGLRGAPLARLVVGRRGLDRGPRASGGGMGGGEPGELDARGGGLAGGHLRRGGRLDPDGLLDGGVDGRGGEHVDPRPETGRVGLPTRGRLGSTDLADPADEVGDRTLVGFAGAAELDPPLTQPAVDAVEPPGLEDLLQQGVPLLRASAQEGLEPALGEQRDLAELGQRHSDQPGDEVAGLVQPGAERVPRVGAVGGGAPLGDHHPGLLSGGAGAALLGPRPGRRPVDAEPAARQRCLQHDTGDDVVGGVVRAEPLGGGPVSGDVAVEREADGVEDAGLAGARGTAEEEQTGLREGVEVDARRVGERAEAGDLEVVEPHAPSPAGAPTSTSWSGSWQQPSIASRSRSDSAVVAATPRTCRTKSRAIAWSPCPVGGQGSAWGSAAEAGNCSTRVCGNRRRSCSMARAGRGTSVSVTWIQSSSRSPSVGSTSRSARDPEIRDSRRGTGASIQLAEAKPLALSSTSQVPLAWS